VARAWWRVPGGAVDRAVGPLARLAILAIGFAIAKIANAVSSLAILAIGFE
jgi:hypothetical protein